MYPYNGTINKMLEVKFFRTPSGDEPTREFLKDLPKTDRAAVGAAIRKLQTDFRLEFPLARNLGSGLWEIRVIGESGKLRVFYCFLKGDLVMLLHAITKKSGKTPKKDLDLARKRKRICEESI